MGLFQQAESFIENAALQRLAGGAGNFADAGSGDHQHLQQMIAQANPQQLQNAFAQSSQQMDPQHLSGADGGPFANLKGPALSMIASLLISHLTGGGGYSPASLLSSVEGMQTTNPGQMDATQVARLAQYTQQNHPDLFGSIAAQLSQQSPGLLGNLLGNAGLAAGAKTLASHFLG